MQYLFKFLNQNKPKLREFDPSTIQRIKEGAYLVKLISEIEVSTRKCHNYAGNAADQKIVNFFADEAKTLAKTKTLLQNYYESITKE